MTEQFQDTANSVFRLINIAFFVATSSSCHVKSNAKLKFYLEFEVLCHTVDKRTKITLPKTVTSLQSAHTLPYAHPQQHLADAADPKRVLVLPHLKKKRARN